MTGSGGRGYSLHMTTAPAPEATTVRLLRDTWRRLNALKVDPADTLDDVVRKLLDERESAAEAGK